MTELNGCVAQSQSAQEMTCLRGTAVPSASRLADPSGPIDWVFAVGGGVGTEPGVGSVMRARYFRRVNWW